MKKLIAFFEIPASDFHRAVKFCEAILGIKMPAMECETEKMAYFMEEGKEQCVGLICRRIRTVRKGGTYPL